MTEVGEKSSIAPYLNPVYWDGHMIGQPNPGDRLRHGLGFGNLGFAQRTLEGYLNQRPAPFPLRTYALGDTFACDEHDPGTIVRYNLEVLSGAPAAVGALEADASELPDRPRDLDFILRNTGEAPRESLSVIEEDGVVYYNQKYFGVVVPGKNGQNKLIRFPSSLIYYRPGISEEDNGRIKVHHFAALVEAGSTFTVDETLHYRAGKEDESLRRVGGIALFSHGTTQKKPISVKDKLASFALNPFAAR